LHRSAGARGCNRARFHAVHLRCLAPAEGIARLHRSAGARGCNRARFHAVYPRGPASAGRMALFTGQQAHAGVTGRGSTPSTRTVPRRQGDGAFHRSAGARGCDGARFHAVYPRGPTSAGRMALFTGQQAHAGVTERGSTPSTRTVPRRQGDGAFHRSAGARGADRARFHAVHLRCLAPAGGTARLHRPAGVQGADRARFHAAHLRCLAPAGG